MLSRLEKLQKMLENEPDDAFLLYSVALEHKTSGRFEDSLAYIDRAIAANPDHAYAHFQRGEIFESLDEPDRAAEAYRNGIEVAERTGDAKAAGELRAALDLVGS